MRKIILFMVMCLLSNYLNAAGPEFPDAAPSDNFKIYWCVKTEDPPVIDGKLDEPIWKEVEPLTDWGITNYGRQTGTIGEIDFRAVWDNKNLYIGARMYHKRKPEDMEEFIKNVSNTTKEIYSRECLEIHIDGNLDHHTRFQSIVNPLPEKMMIWHYDFGWGLLTDTDYGLNADWDVAGSIEKDHWTVEIRYSLKDIQIQPRVGYMFGINPCWFNWADSREDNKGYWWQFITWSTHGDSHHDPRLYGRFILVEKKPKNIVEGLKLAFPDLDKRTVTVQTPEGFISFVKGVEKIQTYAEKMEEELEILKNMGSKCVSLFSENEKYLRNTYLEKLFDENIKLIKDIEQDIRQQKGFSIAKLREFRTKIQKVADDIDALYWRAKEHILLMSLPIAR